MSSYLKKSDLKNADIGIFRSNIPDFKNINDSKSIAVTKWIIACINRGLQSGDIQYNDILPSKSEFAYILGVSLGTVQSAFRRAEDLGFLESKQCIGTIVKNANKSSSIRKLTSKRDLAVEAIKKYIITDKFSVGEILPSSRTMATIIGFNANTTRIAIDYLTTRGIIEQRYKNAKEHGYILKSIDFSSENINKSATLVNKIAKDLEEFIEKNLHQGDKMPSHIQLSNMLKVSIKTIHDALKILINKGIILSRRGRYGSTVIKMPKYQNSHVQKEMSIFAPAKEAAFYHYEKTQEYIKRMIVSDYNIGDKLPSIQELSVKFDLSPNTIRKAFHNLSKEGYLVFSRGRYGGTFVIDIPEIEGQAFKWIAVDPHFVKEFQKNN